VRDLLSAGLSKELLRKVVNPEIDILERWSMVEPYWLAARHTGYGRVLDICCRDIYGLPSINRDTIVQLNKLFRETSSSGIYKKILKEKSRILFSIIPCNDDYDREFFRSVGYLDHFIFPIDFNDVRYIESRAGIQISCFDDWLEACEKSFNYLINSGCIGLKIGLAYKRSLRFNRCTKNEAEQEFNRFFFSRKHLVERMVENLGFETGKHFQDYMFHFIMHMANKNQMVVQIHTGLLEGSGNILAHSDPTLLTNLFIEYPDIRFDIFHMGYPYQNVVGALAKMFPNVWIDMCWAHAISPEASIRALVEWIDSVPVNKISAFGGDYKFIDGVYGHQRIARENVARTLSEKISLDVFDFERACEIARMLFVENPLALFRLKV